MNFFSNGELFKVLNAAFITLPYKVETSLPWLYNIDLLYVAAAYKCIIKIISIGWNWPYGISSARFKVLPWLKEYCACCCNKDMIQPYLGRFHTLDAWRKWIFQKHMSIFMGLNPQITSGSQVSSQVYIMDPLVRVQEVIPFIQWIFHLWCHHYVPNGNRMNGSVWLDL